MDFGALVGIAAVLSWGSADFCAALAVRKYDAMRVIFWSQAIVAAGLTAICLAFFDISLPSTKLLGAILAVSLLSVTAYLAHYKGLQIGKISVISPIVVSWPVISVVLSILFLNESLTWFKAIGVVLAISGGILVSFRLKDLLKYALSNSAKGVGYAFAAMLCFGIYYFSIGILVNKVGWFLSIFLTRIVALFYLATYVASTAKFSFPPRAAKYAVVLVGIFELLAFMSYNFALRFTHTSILAPLMAGIPVVTILLAMRVLKERLEINQYVGIVCAVMGAALLAL